MVKKALETLLVAALLAALAWGAADTGGAALAGDAADGHPVIEAGEAAESEAREKAMELQAYLDGIFLNDSEPAITKVYAKEEADPALAAYLAKYYAIPEADLKSTRYYYNCLDLDGDGADETFAIVLGEDVEYDDGFPAIILRGDGEGGYERVFSFSSIQTPVLVSDGVTNGWHDLVFYQNGRGLLTGYVTARWQDGGYGIDEEQVEDENHASGVQILSNNLIDDMDRGTYLTLGE